MASLKRLLGPTEEIENSYSFPRGPFKAVEYEEIFDVQPSLEEQSWDSLFNNIFSSDQTFGDRNVVLNDMGVTTDDFCYAQEGIELWADQAEVDLPETATVTPTEQPQLCYGMVYRAAVKLKGNMFELDAKLSQGDECQAAGHYALRIVRDGDQLSVAFADGMVLGDVNTQLTEALMKLINNDALDLEVLVYIRTVREMIGKVTKADDAIVRVNINVYGPRRDLSTVGRELSKSRIYLQRPDFPRRNTTYENPHFLKLPHLQASNGFTVLRDGHDNTTKQSELEKAKEFKKIIGDVYTSLKRSHNLHGLEGDVRLKTELLPHQKEALGFMIQREDGPIPDEFSLWRTEDIEGIQQYRHLVTRHTSRLRPSELGGGILADEMGMGKSLAVIALVLNTLEAAHDWSTKVDVTPDVVMSNRQKSRATLIVASSALMINEWFQELETHLHEQVKHALKTIKYHGQYRDTDLAILSDSDIVITTYHTLAADLANKKNPLGDIHWFRVVLDEAHIIRRQATSLNRTVSELHARTRWCLSGTPIQNRLEDIGSLFSFIKAHPFERLSTFRRFIAAPFDEGGERRNIAIERFTHLLDSLCLRRTKELLHLPDLQDRIRKVEFSENERTQYEQTKNMMIRAIKHQPGVYDRKSTLGMFQAQLQLRILCNHGTWQDPFSWKRRSLLEEREDAACSLGGFSETICSSCRQSMPIIDSNSVYRAWAERCAHVLCSECLQESALQYNQESVSHCPLCNPIWRQENSVGGTPAFLAQSSEPDVYFRPCGYSSKMVALLSDIQEGLWETKSIVFSCWTRTLNLMQRYLVKTRIPFERIDGECPLPKRQRILNNFARDPSLRVLIMTTGTGAVGLNLTSANRVFIVEPQWNPSVENQAIARALRLGQGQSVLVTRYVIQGTVEQEMRSQQDRKLRIAGIGWEN